MRVDDLEKIEGFTTIQEWVDSFNDDDRGIILDTFMKAQPSQVWPVVSKLDDNPFPFKKSALESYMRRIKGDQ